MTAVQVLDVCYWPIPASETADNQVTRHSAEYEKVLNEQAASGKEEAGKISDLVAKDRWSKLTDNIRAQLVS